MSISNTISVNGMEVQIVRKDIKNVHLGVYPPDGRVRIAVPANITDDNVRLAIISRLAWIKKQQSTFINQPRQSEREMLSGESHFFLGKRYLLKVIEHNGKSKVEISFNKIKIFCKNPNKKKLDKILSDWYRQELKKILTPRIESWEEITGKKLNSWDIRRMKTKWGSCNIQKKSILINSEMIKKPVECLDYVIVCFQKKSGIRNT